MLDYDTEAERYDATRGGQVRAEAAAAAVDRLLGPGVRRVLDVGAGTGSVGAVLAASGRQVFGADASRGMLARAADRLPGRRLCADAAKLPVADGVFDGVYAMWLLHLVPDPAAVIAECVRVLRPGGVLVTSVGVHASHQRVPSDVTEVLGRYLTAGWEQREGDEPGRVRAAAVSVGAEYTAETTYVGHGRGMVPHESARALTGDTPPTGWIAAADRHTCARELAALPDQELARPDPVYTLVAFTVR